VRVAVPSTTFAVRSLHFHFHRATLALLTPPGVITDSAGWRESGSEPTTTNGAGATHAALRRHQSRRRCPSIRTKVRMTLATGAVTLLSQGNEAGYVLLAVAVFASRDGDASDDNDRDAR
jgi:hypothetical protein